jgi:hypothetical protein
MIEVHGSWLEYNRSIKREWNRNNKDRVKAHKDAWRKVNRHKDRAYAKKYSARHSEYKKQYYLDNRELIIEKSKKYMKDNSAAMKKAMSAWYFRTRYGELAKVAELNYKLTEEIRNG